MQTLETPTLCYYAVAAPSSVYSSPSPVHINHAGDVEPVYGTALSAGNIIFARGARGCVQGRYPSKEAASSHLSLLLP